MDTDLIPDGKISKLAALSAEFIDLTEDGASNMPLNHCDAKAIFKYVSTSERGYVDAKWRSCREEFIYLEKSPASVLLSREFQFHEYETGRAQGRRGVLWQWLTFY